LADKEEILEIWRSKGGQNGFLQVEGDARRSNERLLAFIWDGTDLPYADYGTPIRAVDKLSAMEL